MRSSFSWIGFFSTFFAAVLLAHFDTLTGIVLKPLVSQATQWFCIVLAIASLSQTSLAKMFMAQCRLAWQELDKIAWPKRRDTIQSVMLVIVVTGIVAFYLWILDSIWGRAISWLIGG